ncbi:RluA family pseudouridine synthase [Crateriforma conspicua]|uniref:RluA family pseudouridine synthase n=1 Tax=Crateriforma conspicua TaxID=2527996 RepID=UPI00118A7D7A|nr:RluA family pseudouridine synthase [Crateriforma conspicua]QDV62736.1 Ribosomal large subunit pseudouridine synthase A [Crateriforma conspicua]
MSLQVLYEDNHLLVVNKPAEIATMGAEAGRPTIHAAACEYLKTKYNKPGNVFVGIVSRLDTMTSGVLVLARTSKAASRLQAQFARKGNDSGPGKVYLAVVQGEIDPPTGHLRDEVFKDDAARRMRTAGRSGNPPGGSAQSAELEYQSIAGDDRCTLLAVRLATGRKHQIRVQFADRGHPILGDRKYGSGRPFPAGISLHSWALAIDHPTKKDRMAFHASPPRSWRGVLADLGVADVKDYWPQVSDAFQFNA